MDTANRSQLNARVYACFTAVMFFAQWFYCDHLSAAVVTFQDASFNPANWTSAKYSDTTPGQTAVFSTTTLPTGGNPGSYRQVLHSFREGALRVSHFRDVGGNPFKWNPSTQGAFTSIDFSFDLVMTNYFNPVPIPAPSEFGAVGYSLLLFQGGHYYASAVEVVSTADNKQWVSINRSNRTASNFNRVNLLTGTLITGVNPDFSASGGEILFGYDSVNSHGSTGVFKGTESGIDNYSVTLKDVSVVPEPASTTLSLLAFGLSGMAIARRKRIAAKR